MARIRSIKPEIATDETLGRCSRNARLLFILSWTVADDWGRFRAAPELLRCQLFPYDPDVTAEMVAEWIKELEDSGRIRCYEAQSQHYALVTNWTKHQRVDNAGRSFFPSPSVAEDVGDSRTEANTAQSDDTSRDVLHSPTPAESRGISPLDHWDHRDHSDHRGDSVLNLPSEPAQEAAEETAVVDEDKLNQRWASALDLLARSDLADAETRGQEIISRSGMLKKLRADREELDGGLLADLQGAHPGWTARRLADAVLAGPPTPRPAYYEPEGTSRGVPMPASVRASVDAALHRGTRDTTERDTQSDEP